MLYSCAGYSMQGPLLLTRHGFPRQRHRLDVQCPSPRWSWRERSGLCHIALDAHRPILSVLISPSRLFPTRLRSVHQYRSERSVDLISHLCIAWIMNCAKSRIHQAKSCVYWVSLDLTAQGSTSLPYVRFDSSVSPASPFGRLLLIDLLGVGLAGALQATVPASPCVH